MGYKRTYGQPLRNLMGLSGNHAQFQLPSSNRSWDSKLTPWGGSRGWGQPKDQFETICTSLMPNFSFLARTEAEIANWLPEGVNNDSKGGSRGWGQLWKLFKKDIYKYQVEFQLYSLNKGWDSNLTPRGQRWPPGRQGGSSGDPHNCGQLALFGVRGWVNQ